MKLRTWSEIFDGGSPEAEKTVFHALAKDILAIQENNRERAGASAPSRTLHAKMVVGIGDASLLIDQELPTEFASSYFQPGARLPVSVRFSNASGVAQHDGLPDMRGAALKIHGPDDRGHDLLMTSFPVSHARDARQFVEFAVLASGDKSSFPARLIEHFGADEAHRMIDNIRQGVRPCMSFALERFWSRGAILWNGAPVRFQLRPDEDAALAAVLPDASDALTTEFAQRIALAPVRFRLALQRYVDEARTPIEDGAIEWTESVSPPLEIATLLMPQQELTAEPALAQAAEVERMVFNPWNAPAEFRPLGNLNRVRGIVYSASAERWRK